MNEQHMKTAKAQSSIELLITLGFGLMVLVPVIILAILQVSSSSSSLSVSIAQSTASKLASIATDIGSQGYPARQTVLIQIPPNVYNIYVGTQNNKPGHEIIFVVRTNAGPSYVTAYTPINVSGYLEQLSQPGTYLVNVSAVSSCLTAPNLPCVYISVQSVVSTTVPLTCYQLVLGASGGGTISTPSPTNSVGCSVGYFILGAPVTLTATANSGYGFGGWTGTSSNSQTSWTLTMPSNAATEQANFQQCYQLTLSYGSGGASATASPANSVGCATGYFVSGDTPTLTATAVSGYTFNSWTGTSSSSSNPWLFTMPGSDASETASFSSPATSAWSTTYILNIDVGGESCVTASGYIYCMGGAVGESPDYYVQYASIQGGGGTSLWNLESNLAVGFPSSCVTTNGYIYCMGSGHSPYTQVQYASVPDGGGPTSGWQQISNSISPAGADMSCVTANNYIYCMGGSTVTYAQILTSNIISTWQTTNSLVSAQSLDTICVTTNGYIYCIGGNSNRLTVQYAQILNGVGTSTWQTTNSILGPYGQGEYDQGCVVASNGYIYCMGGIDGDSGITVQYAKILNGAGISAWTIQSTNRLAVREDGTGCIITGNYIYCMGQNPNPYTVQYASIPS